MRIFGGPCETSKGRRMRGLFMLEIGRVTLLFSHKTLIGVDVSYPYPSSGVEFCYELVGARHDPSPTMRRHVKQMGMLEPILLRTGEELQEVVRAALFEDLVAAPLNHPGP